MLLCMPDANEIVYPTFTVGQNMTGALPTELAKIPYLQAIAFYHNDLTGTIPEVYANMKHLLSLELHFNMLTGTIPDVYWGANALQHLNLGENMLSGTVSTEIGKLTNLKGLFIMNNLFNGKLPSEIGNLEFLCKWNELVECLQTFVTCSHVFLYNYAAYTRMNQNDFVGAVPTEMGRLTLLRELWLWDNGFQGAIPSEFGLMKDMGKKMTPTVIPARTSVLTRYLTIGTENMEIYDNTFTGTIPEAIYDLIQLSSLDVSKCQLSGTLSTKIGQLTKMERFRVSRNQMSGSIPQEVGNFTSLSK